MGAGAGGTERARSICTPGPDKGPGRPSLPLHPSAVPRGCRSDDSSSLCRVLSRNDSLPRNPFPGGEAQPGVAQRDALPSADKTDPGDGPPRLQFCPREHCATGKLVRQWFKEVSLRSCLVVEPKLQNRQMESRWFCGLTSHTSGTPPSGNITPEALKHQCAWGWPGWLLQRQMPPSITVCVSRRPGAGATHLLVPSAPQVMVTEAVRTAAPPVPMWHLGAGHGAKSGGPKPMLLRYRERKKVALGHQGFRGHSVSTEITGTRNAYFSVCKFIAIR